MAQDTDTTNITATTSVATRPTPRMVSTPDGGKKSIEDLTHDEKLWQIRHGDEYFHRVWIWRRAIDSPYRTKALDDNLAEMTETDCLDACNKSFPVYIIPDRRGYVLRVVLHNYIYRRWFRPYRSKIDCDRFLCKFITPTDLTSNLDTRPWRTTVGAILSLNNAICDRVVSLPGVCERRGDTSILERCPNYTLQPLFRGLVVVVDPRKYNEEDYSAIGSMPVFLVRTGIEEGLSAPITFESLRDVSGNSPEPLENMVETTLDSAIAFLIDLEAQEYAVTGYPYNPGEVAQVSDEKLAEWGWCGDGAKYDSYVADKSEERAFRLLRIDRIRRGELPPEVINGQFWTKFDLDQVRLVGEARARSSLHRGKEYKWQEGQ
jgi:hypothetical protein